MISPALFKTIVAQANLAPSVHNTQPTRWRLEGDGAILIGCDLSRMLAAGDPLGRDAGLSCGAAAEGTVMALGDAGYQAVSVEDLWLANDRDTMPGCRLAARITVGADGFASPLGHFAGKRFTWRSRFLPAAQQQIRLLGEWAASTSDVALAHEPGDIAMLASLNDEASMPFFRDRAFRFELVNWMRFSPDDARYWRDGLNLDAMAMSAFEGKGAKALLGTSAFDWIDRIGLGKALTGESAKTRTSSAIALFHRPAEESPMTTGRAFYRFWLNLTRLGFAAWPMAALADNPESAALCTHHFGIDPERRLVNVLRVGLAGAAPQRKARLETDMLVV